MSDRILKERELTRLSFLAASICSRPDLWERFLMIVTGTIKGDIFHHRNGDIAGPPEFEDVVNGMWDAFSESQTVREAAGRLYAQGGARQEAARIILNAANLNYHDKELRLKS